MYKSVSSILKRLFAAFVCAALAVGSAVADDHADCVGTHLSTEGQVAACTRIIVTGRLAEKDLAAIYYFRGAAYALGRPRDFGRAMPDLERAIQLDSKLSRAFYLRGFVRSERKELVLAITDLNESIRLDPKYGLAYFRRGDAYQKSRDHDHAIADFTALIRLEPKNAFGYNSRGLSLTDNGDLDRAMSDVDQAVRLDPNLAAAYNNRARIHILKKEFDRAIQDLTISARLAPKNPTPLRNRAISYENKRQPDRALADWRAALALDPSHPDTIKAIRRLEQEQATGEVSRRRVALVIGNGSYRHAPSLANPANDAADLAQVLKKLGFEVIEGRDLDKSGMEQKIQEFDRKLAGTTVALFFYAGHGIQVNLKNYLIPVDAKIEKPEDLASSAHDVAQVISRMEAVQRANIVILDACRENPFAAQLAASLGGRSVAIGKGLAPIENAIGTMTVFSTKPAHVALDGVGRNSPFTTALLKFIGTPGLEIGAVLKRVRSDVYASTKGQQVPFDESSLITDIVLAE